MRNKARKTILKNKKSNYSISQFFCDLIIFCIEVQENEKLKKCIIKYKLNTENP